MYVFIELYKKGVLLLIGSCGLVDLCVDSVELSMSGLVTELRQIRCHEVVLGCPNKTVNNVSAMNHSGELSSGTRPVMMTS